MEKLKILEKAKSIDWEYDEEADVLYLSLGRPAKSLAIDVGEGVIIRYDEKSSEVTGLTIIGLKERSLSALKTKTA